MMDRSQCNALIALLFPLALTVAAQAQPGGTQVTGRWTTIDDNTGKPRSVVEIVERNGRLHGRIVDLYDRTKLNKVCDKCPDERKNQRIVGLEIIRDMVRSGNEWHSGTILDPETGKVYDCKLWIENGSLKVRGYVAFFFRTQTWLREK